MQYRVRCIRGSQREFRPQTIWNDFCRGTLVASASPHRSAQLTPTIIYCTGLITKAIDVDGADADSNFRSWTTKYL